MDIRPRAPCRHGGSQFIAALCPAGVVVEVTSTVGGKYGRFEVFGFLPGGELRHSPGGAARTAARSLRMCGIRAMWEQDRDETVPIALSCVAPRGLRPAPTGSGPRGRREHRFGVQIEAGAERSLLVCGRDRRSIRATRRRLSFVQPTGRQPVGNRAANGLPPGQRGCAAIRVCGGSTSPLCQENARDCKLRCFDPWLDNPELRAHGAKKIRGTWALQGVTARWALKSPWPRLHPEGVAVERLVFARSHRARLRCTANGFGSTAFALEPLDRCPS